MPPLRAVRVFDQQGQVLEMEAGPELEAGLREGRFSISNQAGPIVLTDESGAEYDVSPEDLAGALADPRFRLQSDAEARAAGARRYAEANPLESGAQAFLGGAGMAINPFAATFLDEGARRAFGAAAEANPGLATAGEVVGTVAPALLTGGGSLAGGGARAGIGAASSGGLSAVAGSAVERALLARFGQGAGSRALATVGGAVADSAVSGAAAAITQSGIRGTPLEAEQVMSDVLFGAALGLGGGALVAGGGALARGAGRALRGSAEAAERAAGYTERLVSRGLGESAPPSAVQRAAAWASGVDAGDLATISRDPRRAFDAAGFSSVARETAESLGALRQQLDTAGAALADAGRRRAALVAAAEGADGAVARATARTALEASQGRVRQAVEALAPDARTASSRALRGLGSELDAAVSAVGDTASAGVALGELDRVIARVDDVARTAGDDGARAVLAEVRESLAAVAGDATVFGQGGARFGELDGARRTLEELRGTLRVSSRDLGEAAMGDASALARALEDSDAVLARVEGIGGDVTGARGALEAARERMAAATEWGALRGAAERGLRAEGGEGVRGAIMQTVGGQAARTTGGMIGALLGGGAGAAAGTALGTLWDVASRPVTAYRRLAQLGDTVRRFGARMDAGMQRLERAISGGSLLRAMDPSSAVRTASRVVIGLRGTPEQRRAEYRGVSEEVRTLAADPDALGLRIGSTIAPVGEASPELADSMALTAVRGVSYLAQHLPAADAPTLMSGIPGGELEPSQWEIDRFLRRYEAVEDPLSILDRAAEGSLHIEHREAVEAVYPEVYTEIQARVADLLGSQETRPPYPVRLQLGVLMGVPADRSLTPSMIAALQSQYAQTTAQHEIINGRGQPQLLGTTASENAQTGSDEIASRL